MGVATEKPCALVADCNHIQAGYGYSHFVTIESSGAKNKAGHAVGGVTGSGSRRVGTHRGRGHTNINSDWYFTQENKLSPQKSGPVTYLSHRQ